MAGAASRRTAAAVAALLLAGLVLHLAGVPGRSLNTDEVYFPLAAREGRLFDAIRADVHPPLEPLLIGAMQRMGLPETGWRVFSVLCWLGAAFFAFRLGRRAGGDALGLAAMTLLLVCPQGALLSRLVRSYALATLLGAWTIDAFLALVAQPSRRHAARFAVVAALGCYAFYYNVCLLAACFVAALAIANRDRAAGRAALLASVAAGLAFAPWLVVLAGQGASSLGGGWVEWSASPLRIVRRFVQVLLWAGGGDAVERGLLAIAPRLAGLGTTAIGLVWFGAGLWRLAVHGDRADRARWLLPCLAGLTAAFALAAHFSAGAFVAVHYFSIVGAAVAPVLAAPLVFWPRRAAAGMVCGLIAALSLLMFPAAAREGDEPLRGAARWVDSRLGDHDLVLGVAWFATDGYRWYGQGRRSLALPLELYGSPSRRRVQPAIMTAADLPRLQHTLASAQRVALYLSHTRWQDADRGVALTTCALRQAGFRLIDERGWPLGAEPYAVRAEIWQRSGASVP